MAWNWSDSGNSWMLPGLQELESHVLPDRLQIINVRESVSKKTVEFEVLDPLSGLQTSIEVTDFIIRNQRDSRELVKRHAARIIENELRIGDRKMASLRYRASKKLDELRRSFPVSVPSKEAHEAAVADARAAGMEIVMGRPDYLLIDFDSGIPPAFMEYLPRINETYGIMEQQSWLSKSGYPHIHVKIIMRTLIPAVERIALQALLGSDPLRELLTLQRIRNGEEEPSCLFRPSRVNEVPTLQTINILTQIVAAGKPTP